MTPDFDGLLTDWLTWLAANKGRSPRTVAKYRGHLERLAAFLALQRVTDVSDVSLALLEEFSGPVMHQAGMQARSRRVVVASIKGFFGWLRRAGKVGVSPAEHLEYPRAGVSLANPATLQSAEAMIAAPDLSTFLGVRDAAILAAFIGCGLRLGGLVGMNESDLVWTQDPGGPERLLFRVTEKGNKQRLVPAPAEVRLYLRAYLGHEDLEGIDRRLEDGDRVLWVSTRNYTVPPHEYHGEARRLAPRSVQDLVEKYGKLAGVPVAHRHPHAYRHLFGTELAEDERAPEMRKELLGHADIRTSEQYTALASRTKAVVMDESSPIRKIKTPMSELVRRLDAAQG